jgi:hypothetical protein
MHSIQCGSATPSAATLSVLDCITNNLKALNIRPAQRRMIITVPETPTGAYGLCSGSPSDSYLSFSLGNFGSKLFPLLLFLLFFSM